MNQNDLHDRIRGLKIVPVIAIDDVSSALPLADALIEGGLPLAENLKDYLAVKTVLAVGGAWVAKRKDIWAGNWDKIRDKCRYAVALVRQLETGQ